MLSIQPSHPQKTTPNLLPARIHHDGPINDVYRYWKPETDEKGTQHAYFRGRHLHGTSIPLPENYTGAILRITNDSVPLQKTPHSQSQSQSHAAPSDDEEDDLENADADMDDEELKLAEQIGSFESITMWEHGGKIDEERDVYVRGLGEWVGWAERMHCDDDDDDDEIEEQQQGEGGCKEKAT